MSIEHPILAVIRFTPSAGYEIKSEFETIASSLFWGMNYGSFHWKQNSTSFINKYRNDCHPLCKNELGN
ncbi:hypothetical protein [Metabacillus idriensis]|uniref:hypothetical protein n=1 Tax=Metabacillus idriensis TaxID=324768 RepID=UPI003D29BAC6